jgi:hypothetical protein
MASSVVTIEEITGSKRRLDLIGGGLPLKGAPWGGTTTVVTQWNAGNPEAVQHVLQPQQDPTSMEGVWRTPQLIGSPCQYTETGGSPQPVTTAASLLRIFASFQQSCQLLRVVWTNRQGERELKMVRIGRLQQFVPKPDTLDDIPWTANFEWISDGGQARTLVAAQDDVLAASRDSIIVLNNVAASIEEDHIRASRQTKNQATQFSLGDLEALAGAPLATLDSFSRAATALSSELQELGKIILKVRDTPAALANRALTTAINAVSVANTFLDEVSRKGPETVALKNNAAYLVQATAYYAGAQSQAQLMVSINERLARSAQQRRSALAGSSSGPGQLQQAEVQQLYIPKDGDTFALLAARFYNNTDLGPALARVNGYSSYAIKPLRRIALVIPTSQVISARLQSGF